MIQRWRETLPAPTERPVTRRERAPLARDPKLPAAACKASGSFSFYASTLLAWETAFANQRHAMADNMLYRWRVYDPLQGVWRELNSPMTETEANAWAQGLRT